MLSPLHKSLFAAVTLSGCFAAQALFVEAQDNASAAQIERLTSSLALCPELSSSVASALDQHHGFLPAALTDDLVDETRQCKRQRRHLPDSARSQMAYTALAALAHSQSADIDIQGPGVTPEYAPLQLRLSARLHP